MLNYQRVTMINQVTIWSRFHDDRWMTFHSAIPCWPFQAQQRYSTAPFLAITFLGTCPWHWNAAVSDYCFLHAVGFCAAVGSQSLGIQHVGTNIWRTFSPQSLWDRTPTSIAKVWTYPKLVTMGNLMVWGTHILGHPKFNILMVYHH